MMLKIIILKVTSLKPRLIAFFKSVKKWRLCKHIHMVHNLVNRTDFDETERGTR